MLKRALALLTVFFITVSASFIAYADSSSGKTSDNFLGGTLNLNGGQKTGRLGIAWIAEAGPRQIRANGTVGLQLNAANTDAIKFTAEYLSQRLTWNYFDATDRTWVQQGAYGLGYDHAFGNGFIQNVAVDGYYSYSPNRSLSPIYVFLPSGERVDVDRNIAGANAFGGSLNFALGLFDAIGINLELDYDNVEYNTDYTPNQNAKGFGGTLVVNVPITELLSIDFLGSYRQPFNQYTAGITYSPRNWRNWSVGVSTQYLQGKRGIPSSVNAMVELNYVGGVASARKHSPVSESVTAKRGFSTIDGWILKPAVFMPRVLAVADPRTDTLGSCSTLSVTGLSPTSLAIPPGVSVSGPIFADQVPPTGSTLSFEIYNRAGVLIYTSPRLGTPVTFNLPPGIDPADISEIRAVNASQTFFVSTLVCS